MKQTSMRAILLVVTGLLTQTSVASPASQQQFESALKAINSSQFKEYQKLRQGLAGYPLTVYLDFERDINNVASMTPAQFERFAKSLENTPLLNRARHRYLMAKGQQRQWQSFLEVSPQVPNDTRLQCYYYRAQLQKGDPQLAWKGAGKLWLTGRSQVKACDVLFSEWKKSGVRTDQDVWNRLLLSLDSRQAGLARYLASQLSANKQALGQHLLAVYNNPKRIEKLTAKLSSDPWFEDIAALAIKRMARRNLETAFDWLDYYQGVGHLQRATAYNLSNHLLRIGLIRQNESVKDEIDQHLFASQQDNLVEIRLRWALAEQDWPAVGHWLGQLSETAKQSDRWQFWQARLYQRQGQQQAADAIFQQLAQNRGFYGFLAADKLHSPYALNAAPIDEDSSKQARIASLATTQRVHELLALGRYDQARSEWLYLLNTAIQASLPQFAIYAANQGWSNFAIEAAIKAKTWDAISVRFPIDHQSVFQEFAKMRNLDSEDLFAIARRESAYNNGATSHVGARGLMQLMPATAKSTAATIGYRYQGSRQLYEVKPNIRLGSAYYKQLLEQFDSNRILAASSYNAGPNKTRAWLRQSQGTLDYATFIETIPYRETREYVQAVLSYRAIYQMLMNRPGQLLSATEKARLY
ncbi:transglycosylase SLT domain-containing protein [Paraferrimonas haliotis]|uniref:Lytic transglycosylase n=1 Tax=Paraferrimonas haliotis TaxID=2013866 RepID=A0AA37TVD3_9GAMM|nr:transglycosylase SLT domain-containing protein [Paraferrimonas haliotis]GLS84721.1 lytic transglycosylase [Paraferrimonas haliotis]